MTRILRRLWGLLLVSVHFYPNLYRGDSWDQLRGGKTYSSNTLCQVSNHSVVTCFQELELDQKGCGCEHTPEIAHVVDYGRAGRGVIFRSLMLVWYRLLLANWAVLTADSIAKFALCLGHIYRHNVNFAEVLYSRNFLRFFILPLTHIVGHVHIF